MADTIVDLWDKLRDKYPGLPERMKPFQVKSISKGNVENYDHQLLGGRSALGARKFWCGFGGSHWSWENSTYGGS